VLPYSAVLCKDVCCTNIEHIDSFNVYASQIATACLSLANDTISFSRCRGIRGYIPGWTEFIDPLRNNSLFWHRMWVNCGRPRNGFVAEVMRKTRAQYHVAIRKVRREEDNIVNDRYAAALAANRNRDFWREVKCIRCRRSNVSSVVDGQSPVDIGNMFASKYYELYTIVSYDIVDMKNICDELYSSIHYAGYDCISFVNTAYVIHACNKLKLGKRDGTIGLWSDHLIHGCSELATHISLLFSAMLIHGVALDDMCSSTIIPIPKGKHANVTDSSNYRGIALMVRYLI